MNGCSKLIRRFLIVSGFFLMPLASAATETGPVDELSPGEFRVAERVAERTGISRDEAIDLRHSGLGWGDVEIAAVVSAAVDAPLATVVELWQVADREWSIVAEEYGIQPLGQLISEHKRASRGTGRVGDQR